MSLARRFVLGSVYLGAGSWLAYLLNFGMQIAIARLLGPSAFGLYAFCFAINEFLNIVGAFSLNFALIQSREESQSHYDTAFAICAGLGGLGLLLAACVAPILGAARSSEAAWILVVMAFARIPRLLSQVSEAHLERALRYGALSVSTTLASVLPNVVAVGLAWIGLGAWSLALRDLLMTSLLLVMTLLWSGYRFRARVERRSWNELMSFSRPMFVSRGLEIAIERLDSLAVGALLGNTATALYHQARFLSEAGFVATRPVERTSFNVYARLQDDPVRLARAYALVNYFLVRVMLAGAAVLLIFPAETVRLLLGEEWAEVAPILRWLALYAGLLPLFHNVKVLFHGLGRVGLMVRVRIVQAVFFSGAVLAATLAGSTRGVAAGLLVTTLLGLALAWRQAARLVDVAPLRLLAMPLLLLVACAGLFAALHAAGVLAWVPWAMRPFLPPLVYLLGILAVEQETLIGELRYLAGQLRRRV